MILLTKDGITVQAVDPREAASFEALGYRPVESPVEVAELSESVEAPKPKRTPAKPKAKKE